MQIKNSHSSIGSLRRYIPVIYRGLKLHTPIWVKAASHNTNTNATITAATKKAFQVL
jgi:hypothetical protein